MSTNPNEAPSLVAMESTWYGIDLVRDRLGTGSTSLPPWWGQEESQASCGWYLPCPAVRIRTWYPLPQAAREHPELLHHHEAPIISTIGPSMSIGAGPPRPPIKRRRHSKDWERLETLRSLLSRNTTFHQSNYSKEHLGSLNDATTGRHESSARDSRHEDYRPTYRSSLTTAGNGEPAKPVAS